MTALRMIFAGLGGLLGLVVTVAVIRTLIVPRSRPGGVFSQALRQVDTVYRVLLMRVRDYETRDRVLASKASVILMVQLAIWLAAYVVAFGLLLWPHTGNLGQAFAESGSSMFTLGFIAPRGAGVTAIDSLAAAAGLVAITLQIAYLPSLYGAFNRRETQVALLQSRAGLPPWGPELLARTRYGIVGNTDDLRAFYAAWELWSADVAESHSNYPILVQFRSPNPYASWLISLLAVMDSAALLLAVAPSRDSIEPRLCLRMGFTALHQIADALGIGYVTDPDAESPLRLTFDEFEAGFQRLLDVKFETERTAQQAWPHFRGWRVNYESIAYALATEIDAVPAMWSGGRRWSSTPIAPRRPPNRRPRSEEELKSE